MLVGLRIREGLGVEVRNHFKSTDVLVGTDSLRLVGGEQEWKRVSDIPQVPIVHKGRMLQNYFSLDATYRYRRDAHAAYVFQKVLNLSQIGDGWD
jgi:hypothetical protein